MTWTDTQRRMVALGFYHGPIDGLPEEGTLAGVDEMLTLIEGQRGVVPPKPPEIMPKGLVLPIGFDVDYDWLAGIGTLPRILVEMLHVYGTKEVAGNGDNPVILAWAKELGLDKVYVHDVTAWCGLAQALAVKRAGYDPVAAPLWALNWLKFGVAAPTPSLGDILVFERFDAQGKSIGGHVGEYLGEDDAYYHVIGGNTKDSLSIARIAKTRLRGARRPAYKNPLPTWKPYHLSTGGVITSNEA